MGTDRDGWLTWITIAGSLELSWIGWDDGNLDLFVRGGSSRNQTRFVSRIVKNYDLKLFWGFFGDLILNVGKELLEIIIFKIIRYTSGNKLKLQESSYKNDRSNFNIFETL